MSVMNSAHAPIFTAVSSSARQLFLLLRCIGFSHKAEAQITADGLRFSVEESRAVQGLTFLEKSLFSSYSFITPAIGGGSSPVETASAPSFQIHLSALLETLQIFGLSDVTASSSRHINGGFSSSFNHNAFNTPALALTGGTCRISYPYIGAPLSITLSEAGVTTTCDLNTYESTNGAAFEIDESIPLQRDSLTLKIIMRSLWLHDAVTELASTNPTVIILTASQRAPPFFALKGAGGPFGDSMVDFQPEQSRNRDKAAGSIRTEESRPAGLTPMVAETFTVLPSPGTKRIRHRYRFEHIQKASRAMALASKVCIRCDAHGVLSLQFMIELSADGAGGSRNSNVGNGISGPSGGAGVGAGQVSFVDYRFVPLVDDDEDEDDTDPAGDDEDEDDTDPAGDDEDDDNDDEYHRGGERHATERVGDGTVETRRDGSTHHSGREI